MKQMVQKYNKTGYSEKAIGIVDLKVDTASRMVEGYFAAFNNIDSDKDMIMPQAFDKSIEAHGPQSTANRKIAHLAFHDTTRPVGVIRELTVDDKGLRFRSEMGRHTDGEDGLMMYQDGIIREHSIGFEYIPERIEVVEGTDKSISYFKLHELKLWEGSFVTWGANSETPNLSNMKSQEDINKEIDNLNERMEMFVKALTDGNYSKVFNAMAEVELMQIKQKFNELLTYEPIEKPKIASTEQHDIKNDVDISKYVEQLMAK